MSDNGDVAKPGSRGETCPRCGGALVSVLPDVCPRCLLACSLECNSEEIGGLSGVENLDAISSSAPILLPQIDELSRLFPNYKWLRLLGKGGMGAVYVASVMESGERVAIKVLFPEFSKAQFGLLERFRREASLLGLLRHPAIVRVLNYHETGEGFACLVMEYVEGLDLARLISAKGRLEPAEALHIIAQVAEALTYVHRKGVLHRDVKPANVLLSRDGSVKLADFGLARHVPAAVQGGLTRIGDTLGTPGYMAPELASRLGADERSDVYSLGVMLYHMLTGRVPQGFFELPSHWIKGVDVGVDNLIACAMRHDPSDRFPTVDHFRAEVLKLLGEDGRVFVGDARSKSDSSNNRITQTNGLLILILLPMPVLLCFVAAFLWPWHDGDQKWVTEARRATVQIPFVNSLGMRFVPISATVATQSAKSLVLFSCWEARVSDFAAFADKTSSRILVPDYDQTRLHPYSHASWDDANRFCKWLSEIELKSGNIPPGSLYRLPTDREWSEAAGIAEREDWSSSAIARESALHGVYLWGPVWPPPPGAGNLCDRDSIRARKGSAHIKEYADGFACTSPVGSFAPLANGIYDMAGNVWEWVDDVYDPKGGGNRILRGGSWDSPSDKGLLEAADRHGADPYDRSSQGIFGFRPVLEIPNP